MVSSLWRLHWHWFDDKRFEPVLLFDESTDEYVRMNGEKISEIGSLPAIGYEKIFHYFSIIIMKTVCWWK